jgi:hypothetical protein
MFAISCGYEDADDLDHLRSDPAFKLACGRLPDSGRDLCSQPTLSRLEHAPRLRDGIRLTYTLVDACMDSYPCEPASVTLDIDDTCDVVHPISSSRCSTHIMTNANGAALIPQSGLAKKRPGRSTKCLRTIWANFNYGIDPMWCLCLKLI